MTAATRPAMQRLMTDLKEMRNEPPEVSRAFASLLRGAFCHDPLNTF